MYMPATHGVHVALVADPVLKEPAGHEPHVPTMHVVHVLVEAPPVLKDPAGHADVH